MQVTDIFDAMLTAAAASGQALWASAKSFAIPELQQVANRIVAIEAGLVQGTLTEQTATELMVMQFDSAVDVLVAMTELVVFQAEAIINAALAAVRVVVNQAVGFALI